MTPRCLVNSCHVLVELPIFTSSIQEVQEINHQSTQSHDRRIYRISRTIRRTFFSPEKCDLNSTCVLYAEGKYLFPNL